MPGAGSIRLRGACGGHGQSLRPPDMSEPAACHHPIPKAVDNFLYHTELPVHVILVDAPLQLLPANGRC
jgi:hypothetical protein